MPKGGFGNLIALPLQKETRKHGNSEFVDENFQSYDDQWAYLNNIRKMNEEEVGKGILNLCNGNEYGDLKKEELEEKPWLRNKKSKYELSQKDFPMEGGIVLANMI
ncbi:hypothetical protein F8154_06645 [Alkaliphilus pronyensis]|uniref:TOTE conflict system primase domain-containing protein n=1 Tax=Alkaliphilus pronyensis TaxID=1482732 RepID=A0A6I0F0D8_9FIRM|nr:hypothetical protein [Alkaliphilus pronyensis]KAB3535367.1 hypothetical protein F8154_06645 [Alkaliphilus pronyensis]